MKIDLYQGSYTFHLASRLKATPGDYLSGEIILPPHSHQDRLTLTLSCVREDRDAPHPCYLHPLLFNDEGKRRRSGNENHITDLKLKLKEEEIIGAFIDESQQPGISIFVENEDVFLVAGQEKIIVSKVVNGKILLWGKHLRLGVVQPVTKSLKRADKEKCKNVPAKLRLKVSCEGSNVNAVGFSRVVEEKLKKKRVLPAATTNTDPDLPEEVGDLRGPGSCQDQEGRKRKREEAVGVGETGTGMTVDVNFGGFPVTLVGSCINIEPAAMTDTDKDILSDVSLSSGIPVLDPNFVNSVLNHPASVMETSDDGAVSLRSKPSFEGPTLEDLKDLEECDWVMVPAKELPIYFLSEVIADQNITDLNMENILHTIRLTATLQNDVYETFGDSWRSGTPIAGLVPKTPERLILHKFGGNKLHDAGFEMVKTRQRNREILQYLPENISESDLRRVVEKSTLSRTLLYNREMFRCMNYVVIVGRRGPIVWRMR